MIKKPLMATVDLHDKPFDETTKIKLTLFESYAQAWIPTFIMAGFSKELHIFDFFAGTGYDKNKSPGSPIRLLEKVIEQADLIFKRRIKIILHFNEFDSEKFEVLKSSCESKMITCENGLKNHVDIKYYNEDFAILFPSLMPLIAKHPSLVYLDQNGIKFISQEYFLELAKTSQTDFMYFLSSSYFVRFGNSPEFKKHIDLNIDDLKKRGYEKIHRNICDHLKESLPPDSSLKLYPFSLRKGVNIHGVIFGAKHHRAVDKFLSIAWKLNPINGDANFDIDNEANLGQIDMFKGQRISKIDSFKKEVRDKILSEEIKTNKELLNFTFEKGHIGKHANECLKEMKKNKEITYNANSPCVTYDSVYKNEKIVHYEKI